MRVTTPLRAGGVDSGRAPGGQSRGGRGVAQGRWFRRAAPGGQSRGGRGTEGRDMRRAEPGEARARDGGTRAEAPARHGNLQDSRPTRRVLFRCRIYQMSVWDSLVRIAYVRFRLCVAVAEPLPGNVTVFQKQKQVYAVVSQNSCRAWFRCANTVSPRKRGRRGARAPQTSFGCAKPRRCDRRPTTDDR